MNHQVKGNEKTINLPFRHYRADHQYDWYILRTAAALRQQQANKPIYLWKTLQPNFGMLSIKSGDAW